MTRYLAILLAALVAVSMPAFADQAPQQDASTAAAHPATTASRDQAKKANTRAAEQAIEAMLEANRLDLDIKLIGPTSTKIARDR
jgi:hypothetical protein